MKRILILPLLFLSQYFFAQTVEVKWGKDLGDKGEANQVTGIDSANNLVYASPALLARVNKLLGKIDIYHTFTYLSKPVRTYADVRTLNHHYASVTSYNEKEKKLQEYYIEIDKTGNPTGPDHLIASNDFTEYKSRPGNSQYTQDVMGYRISDNKKMILNFSQNSVHDLNKSPEKIYLTVLDEDLNVIWKKEQVFAFDDRVVDFQDAYITNSGKVILIGTYPKTLTTGMLRKELAYSYKLFEVTADGLRETAIGAGLEIQPVSFLLKETTDGNIMAAGIYYAPSKSYTSNSSGIFTAKLDMSSFAVVSRNTKPYNFSSITNQSSKLHFTLDEINPRPSDICMSTKGDLTLILRIDWSNGGGKYGTYGYDFISIGNDSKIISENIVESQFLANVGYGKKVVYDFGDKILLLGNNGDFKTHVLKATFFDYSGKVLSEKELQMSNSKYYYVPWASSKFSDTAIRVGAAPSDANGYTPIYMYGVVTIK